MVQPPKVRAHQLVDWLDSLPSTVKALSLDCFDTIVWRSVGQPVDVFFALQDAPSWRRHGVKAHHRSKAESRARARKVLLGGVSEVSIDEIYKELLPDISEEERAECIEEELAEEVRHSFIFAPTLELIRKARQKGLRVIVVSDTYLGKQQLKWLLTSLMDSDELEPVHVYCSSEYGVSKAGGIWPHVMRAERLQSHQLAHLGDNEVADGVSPRRFGIQSAHLHHYEEDTGSALRSYASASSQLMPEIRNACPMPSYFHHQLSRWDGSAGNTASKIGYRSMGPIMYAFARYLEDRVRALETQGRKVRVAFLMRDGYLPMRVFSSLSPAIPAAELRISRFTANASSIRSRDDVVNLLATGVDEKNADAILKQLLFTPQEAQDLIERAAGSGKFQRELCRRVLRDDHVRKTLERSKHYRDRLYAHIQTKTGLQCGETLVFVDLGYSGTVQTRLRQMLQDDWDVELKGLYLIASAAQADMSDREGMIDPSWADERMIIALTAYIGLFEMMCAKAEPSTVDYTPEGEPIFGRQGTKGQQSVVAQEIQSGCLDFAATLSCLDPVCRPKESLQALARQAAGELCRLTYFPQSDEIECLAGFEFDFNLGTDLVLATADLEAGAQEYRREGFALMNRDFTQMRVSYPMEMRYLDLALATTLLSARRYGYGIRPQEMSYRRIQLPVLAADAHSHALQEFTAVATHDGYYSLLLPHSASFDISVLLGEVMEWVQIDAVQMVSVADSSARSDLTIGEHVILDGAKEESDGLYRLSRETMLLFPRSAPPFSQGYVIRLVFRPISLRVGDL